MKLNITTEAFKQKPTSYSNLKFIQLDTSIEGMADLIKKGYGFTSLYSVQNLVTKTKNMNNWKETWFIAYDIDKVNISMDELYDKLSVKPSISYTTPSNEKEEGIYCYRLVYVLNKPISNIDEFKYYYLSFSEYLGITNLIDNKAKDCTRYFNGSYSCNQIINKESIIDLSNTKCFPKDNTNNIQRNIKREAILNGVSNRKHHSCFDIDEEFLKDYNTMSFKDFFIKYQSTKKYINQEHTFLEDDGKEPKIILPKDYYEIVRKQRQIEFHGRYITVPYIFKDHEGRRNLLWHNGMIRRKINNDLTFEDILYDLCYEVSTYFDNSDGQLTKSIIFGIAKSVMEYDIDKYDPHYKCKNTFKISTAYCHIHLLSKKKVLGMVMGKERSKFPLVEQYYKEGLSVSDVLNLMVQDGITISDKTVRRWFNKNVEKHTFDEIMSMIDTSLSIRKNLDILKNNGVHKRRTNLIAMIKEKKSMKNTAFESDEEMFRFQKEMMENKRKKDEGKDVQNNVISCVPEPSEGVCAVDPTTIREEEKEELTEEINKFYVDIEKRIKPQMTLDEKSSVKSIINMSLYFGKITEEEAKTLRAKNNCSMLVTPYYAIV